MYSIATGIVLKTSCTWPVIRSVIAGPSPRYGTCSISVPVVSEILGGHVVRSTAPPDA
jgi:hypothetical protein